MRLPVGGGQRAAVTLRLDVELILVHVQDTAPGLLRDGDDLRVEVPITLPEAVSGGTIEFEGPTGEVSLKIPPGTQSGRKFRLRGLGVQGKGGRGNLYVRVSVVLPDLEDATPEQRAALESLAEATAALYSDDVRVKVKFK